MSRGCAWEHFSHGADIGIRGIGDTPARAFEQAALALTAVVTDPGSVEPREEIPITCEEADLELLFADWLNAVIYEMATRDMLFSDYRVTIDDGRLTAGAAGETVDRGRHQPAVEPKGATYTQLRVTRHEDGRWQAQCIIDV